MLKTNDVGNISGSTGIKITDGVFSEKKKIRSLKDLSGQEHQYIKKVFDCRLVIEFEDGRNFDIFGNFKRNGNVVEGWGGAFVLALLFENVGEHAELDANFRFKKTDLKKLIGKEIVIVNYTSGTYEKDGQTRQSYSNWNLTFRSDLSDDELKDEVFSSWVQSRDRGYPNNYEAPINSDGSTNKTSSSSAREVSTLSAGTTASERSVNDMPSMDDMDDDLPF